jgi:hypothetical protein
MRRQEMTETRYVGRIMVFEIKCNQNQPLKISGTRLNCPTYQSEIGGTI